MNKMKLGPKLIGGFALVALIAGTIGFIGIKNIHTIDDADTKLYEQVAVPLGSLSEVSTAFQRVRVNARDMLLAKDSNTRDAKIARINELSKAISENAEEYEKTIFTEEGRKTFAEFKEARTAYRAHLDQMIAAVKAGRTAEGWAVLNGEGAKSSAAEQKAIQDMVDQKVSVGKKIADGNTALADKASTIMIALIVGGCLLAMAIGIWLTLSITRPLKKGVEFCQELAKGHLGTRLKMDRGDEIGQLARTMDEFADGLQNNVVATLKKVAAGDVSTVVKAVDEKDEISPALIDVHRALNGLIAEAGMLTKAAVEGRLGTRGKAENYKGGYREIVEGVNKTLDAVIGPLNVAAEYVDKISKGNIPAKITDNYNGDFNIIKGNLNQCIDAVNNLTGDAGMLAKAAVEGRLATRADAAKHWGDYKKIVEGVNNTLDSVIGPLNVAADYVDKISKGNIPAKITDNYNGDFNAIKNNLNTCIEAVNLLVSDAGMLAKAAEEGRLQTRADATKHGGDFRKIVEGVNNTLDGVILPITEAANVMEKVAEKNMTARVKGEYKGDLGKFKESINKAVDNLDQSLQQVAVGAEQVSSASGQIGSGSQALAQGASEQASSLEEISSSLQEMTSMTKQNTANAREAKGLSDAAKKGADKGVANMKNLSAAVDKIKKSSDDTAKIVKTIDEIAFQTNLLALNAAVEAARAGDAGKGFAVVAEEVRNLAMRSAEAAKNTANMIEESVKNAENGVALNGEVMKNFDEITTQATKVSEVMAEIAAASEQQSQGIEQVTTAVQQMNQLTQQSAANSEESASAAEELSSQAQEMQAMVASFQVSSETGREKKARPVHHEAAHAAPVAAVSLKKPAKEQKVPVAAGAHKEPASVIPFGDGKEGLKSF